MLFLKRGSDPRRENTAGLESRDLERLVFALLLLAVLFFFFDQAVVSWFKYIHDAKTPLYFFLDGLTNVMDYIGHGSTLIVGSLALYLGGRFISGRVHMLGKTLFIGLLSSGIAVQIVKHLVGRGRPRRSGPFDFIGPSFVSGYDSFPSGHTAVAFCLAYILSRYFPPYRPAFYLFALSVAFQRIGDVSHFPTDIFGGAVIGIIIAKLLLLKMRPQEKTAACNKLPEAG